MEPVTQIPEKIMQLVQREASRRRCSIREQIAHWLEIARATALSDRVDFSKIDESLDGMRDPRELHEGEHAVWAEAFVSLVSMPSETEAAFFAHRRRHGLGVGIDATGHLVHARPEDS